jgi:hypothetical protein
MILASRTLLLIVALLAAVMLLVGLNPRGFDGSNGVTWNDDADAGARFKRGIAYTPALLRSDMLADGGRQWTWHAALDTVPRDSAGFAIAAVLYSGRDDAQIQIAQWRQTLVVMAGNDYARWLPGQRLTYELAPHAQALVVSVVHDADGVGLYVDGEPISRDSRASWPAIGAPEPARLILGGTVTGQHAWRGSVRWTSLIDRALSAEEVKLALAERQQHPADGRADGALLDFDLRAGPGRRVPSGGSLDVDLRIPATFQPPVLRALSWPDVLWPPSRAMAIDITVNLLGFMPFGFFAAWLCHALGYRVRVALMLTLAGALLLSLTIELAQVWLPTRDSSLLDLVMNGLGAAAGAVAFVFRPRNPRTFLSEG